jgi:tRNA modification GTPase
LFFSLAFFVLLCLFSCLAHCEAIIDFAEDESDVNEEKTRQAILCRLNELHSEMSAHLADDRRGELVREGYKVAIIGAPNAGKSTLINTLAQRNVSIVSAFAGTTRDTIETQVDVDGLPVRLIDTAGLRDFPNQKEPKMIEKSSSAQEEDIHEVERQGIQRGREEAASSQLQIAMFDSSLVLATNAETSRSITMDLFRDTLTANLINTRTLVVLSKADMLTSVPSQADLDTALLSSTLKQRPLGVILISCKQKLGINSLLNRVGSSLRYSFSSLGTDTSMTNPGQNSAESEKPKCVITRARHREHVSDCVSSLELAKQRLSDLVAVSEHLRQASHSLARITGHVDVEQLLDIVFRDFCIGK